MSLTSRASGRKHYLWTAFRPTWAGGNLLRWVAKGTQIPSPLRPAAWLFPAGKRRKQNLRSGTAREVCSDNNSFPLRAPKPHHFHGWGKMHSQRSPLPAQPLWSVFPPIWQPLPRPAWEMRRRSRSREHQHPSCSLPARPPAPRGAGDGLLINGTCFPFQVTGKKNKTHQPREAGRAGGWGELSESFGMKPYPQWISHAERWFSKLLPPPAHLRLSQ